MWIFRWKGPSGFSARSTAEEVTQGIDGTGLTAIVTGASSGIGAETTGVLALRGVQAIMAARNLDAGRNVREGIGKEIPTAKVDVMELDLSSTASVRKFALAYNSSGLPLNILINNAGIKGPPFGLSKDDIEMQFATNHLAREYACLGTIKACQCIAFQRACKDFEEGENMTANSVHPGAVAINILRRPAFLFAATQGYVALHPRLGGVTGEYFADSNKANPSSLAKDKELAKKLWDFSL